MAAKKITSTTTAALPPAGPAQADVQAQPMAEGMPQASTASLEPATTPPDARAAAGADSATRTYLVGTVPIRHNGVFYGVGSDIVLTDAEAARLDGLVVPIPATLKE